MSSLWRRIGAHSHIRGLGVDGIEPKPIADGMVGQIKARKAAAIVARMISRGVMAGRAILLAGPPGTGKTSIAVGLAKELGADVPFVQISGSEIYSSELKKTEVLMRALRKAIGVKIHERRRIYEGVVVELNINMVQSPYNPYQRIPESVRITLRAGSEREKLRGDRSIAEQIIAQGVSEGDVIMIDSETGRVIRVGRCSEYAEEKYELSGEKTVPTPPPPVLKEKEIVYTMTLHDLDEMEAGRSRGVFSLLFGGGEEKEISPDIRAAVDERVKKLVENKGGDRWAEIVPGVLFIEEGHMLDIEAFCFLNRAIESELAPIVIITTNRGITKIRGTDVEAPHGMPLDLLDRLFIITTDTYNEEEVRAIIKERVRVEGVRVDDKALAALTKLGVEKSLRYAIQLIAPAYEVAKAKGRDVIAEEDVEEVAELFSDVKRSVEHLKRYEKELLA
ncbi:MAG: TATA box-binding protein [Thermoproteota archaeon]|nr:MAG: TATA box-binding protein [Candidatus Korarchaeota archaeon]